MLTTITLIVLVAAGVADVAMVLRNRATARRRAVLRERLNRLAAADGPATAMARFQRSLDLARAAQPGLARVEAELASAEWEGRP